MKVTLERLRFSCGGAILFVILAHLTGLAEHNEPREWIYAAMGAVAVYALCIWEDRKKPLPESPK